MIFKVGDKVKINCTDRWYSAKDKFNLNGQEYRIIKIRKPRYPGDEFVYSLDVPDAESCSIYSNPSIWLWSKKEFELVKPKFDIKNYPGNYVMYCKTYDEAKYFYEYISDIRNERFLTSLDNMWHDYKNNLCFDLNYRSYCGEKFYKNSNYTILYFEDFDWSDFKMLKDFTKADLKNGDVVKISDGTIGIICLDTDTIILKDGFDRVSELSDDLKFIQSKRGAHITMVRRPYHSFHCQFDAFELNWGELVYERKEVEEMTLEEVCKALGKEIKIVKKK